MKMAESYATRSLVELTSLKGRVALVTGGANGIGAATATRLSEAGASVVVGDLDGAGAQSVADGLPGQALGIHMDVSDDASVVAGVQAARDAFGDVTILVNNAGIYPLSAFLDTSDQTWAGVQDVNVGGMVRCARQVVRHMVAAGSGGVIVNLASVQAFRAGVPGLSVYTTSKGAVRALTQALALELGPAGIRVVGIAPTMVDTPGTRAQAQDYEEATGIANVSEAFVAQLPLRRIAVPDDIARVIAFAASDMAAFVTGQTILVDGGHTTT